MKNLVNKKYEDKTIKRSKNSNTSNKLQRLLETRKETIREENIYNTKKEFLELDIDNSGYIDIKELHKGLKQYGINLTLKNTQNLLKKYDDNPDGKIEMGEFIQLKNDIDTKRFRKSNRTKRNKRKRKNKSKNTNSRK